MARLFVKQSKEYAFARPSYPSNLFQFIASNTPSHNLAWDAGTGTGQAAKQLAAIYKNVIATDVSEKQLEFATKLPNVKYQHTPPIMSMADLEQKVAPQGTLDLVTIAQALHWFDLPTFYEQVKFVLKKPNGVIAAWCYDLARISSEVDKVLDRLYYDDLDSYWDPKGKLLVDKSYRSIDFPFEPLDGFDHTGPLEFVSDEIVMDLDHFLTYIRSWSAYQTAKDEGIEFLGEDVVEELKLGWGEDSHRVAKFPIYLRIGRGCEREVAEAANGDSEDRKNESIMRLSWALVHSRQKEDVQRGIDMLEASLGNERSPLHQREKLYLLAVGYYRRNNYARSRQLLGRCLEIAPDWRQALSLQKIVEDQIAKDGVIGIGITATAVGLVVGGIAAALARKS